MPAPYSAPSIPAAASSSSPSANRTSCQSGAPGRPARSAGRRSEAGGASSCSLAILCRSAVRGLLLGGELGLSGLVSCSRRLISVSVRALGERGEHLGERGRVRLADPVQGAGERVRPDSSRIADGLVTGPPGRPAAQLPGHVRAGGGQPCSASRQAWSQSSSGLPGLAEFGLGELAGLLGLADGGEAAADLGDVVAPRGDPGLGRHGQVGAGIGGLAVAEQARSGRRLGQRLQVPADGAAQLVRGRLATASASCCRLSTLARA